jgi:hypothetical protein
LRCGSTSPGYSPTVCRRHTQSSYIAELTEDGLIANLHIIYDTSPIRGDFEQATRSRNALSGQVPEWLERTAAGCPLADRFTGWPPFAGARAANAYPLGHDRHSFGECFAFRRCRWRRLQHWSADRNLRPLIEAGPISRHPSITGTRRACMSLVIENDGIAEPTPLVFLRCRAATEFEP